MCVLVYKKAKTCSGIRHFVFHVIDFRLTYGMYEIIVFKFHHLTFIHITTVYVAVFNVF